MATHTRSGHTRRTASGGTTQVRTTKVQTKGAKVAEDIRNHSATRRTYAAMAALTVGSVAYGIVQALWVTGGAVVVAVGTTVAFMWAAERYGIDHPGRILRHVRRNRPRYRSLATYRKLRKTKKARRRSARRAEWRKNHPVQAALWSRYGAKWEVELTEGQASMKHGGRKKPRVTTRTGRGHRGRSKISREAARHGWATTGTREVLR